MSLGRDMGSQRAGHGRRLTSEEVSKGVLNSTVARTLGVGRAVLIGNRQMFSPQRIALRRKQNRNRQQVQGSNILSRAPFAPAVQKHPFEAGFLVTTAALQANSSPGLRNMTWQ